MIPEIGQFALIIALLLAVTQATLPMIGAARGNRSWMSVAVPAGQAQFIFVANRVWLSCLVFHQQRLFRSQCSQQFQFSAAAPLPARSDLGFA